MSAGPANPGAPATRKRAGGVIVPHSPRWFQRLGAFGDEPIHDGPDGLFDLVERPAGRGRGHHREEP